MAWSKKRRKLSKDTPACLTSSGSTACSENDTTTGPVSTHERVDASDATSVQIEASSPLSVRSLTPTPPPPLSESESESVDAEHDTDYDQQLDNSHKLNSGYESSDQAAHVIPTSTSESAVLQDQCLPDLKLLEDLQFLDDYRVIGEEQSRRIILRGHFRRCEVYWISEYDVHRISDALVNTFWESREDGQSRPEKEIPEQLLRIHRKADEGFRVQMVGAPLFNLNLQSYLDKHKEEYKHRFEHQPCYKTREDLEHCWPGCFDDPAISMASMPTEHNLVMIFSHRVNLDRKTPCFEFFCFWRHKKGSWELEMAVQKLNSPVVVTYWHSSTEGIREEQSRRHGIPVQYLKILSHRRGVREVFLTVQLVGKSQSKDDVEELKVGDLMRRWKGPTTKYLRENKLKA
ncbi:uncharacterized protein FTOL_08629 [Fusarium torulosum]|uniref:Uncharacterized protein n=1 Tax=Fusarium torulosum TaxID=33205 RepID=A0AAE8MDL4_9HYPO|nr:uncharacterized protein FTOL_08629 [Fusarium torulosum]